jgi:hypothetical protein
MRNELVAGAAGRIVLPRFTDPRSTVFLAERCCGASGKRMVEM